MSEHPPIVILTSRELEYKAVRDRLSGIRGPSPAVGARFEVGSLGDGEVVLALAGPGAQGTAGLAERAIRVFAPRALLFVGVAEARKPSVRPGDVVVATYLGRADGRWRTWEMDRGLERTARRIARRAGGPRVHFGPLVPQELLRDAPSGAEDRGDADMCSEQSADSEGYDDALAIEPDAAAVARAGRLGSVPVGVIRGIGDRDSRRPGAAGVAADFALALAAELINRQRPAGEAGREAPDIRVKAKSRPGVVAGLIGGGVHNQNTRPGWSTGPGREERGRR